MKIDSKKTTAPNELDCKKDHSPEGLICIRRRKPGRAGPGVVGAAGVGSALIAANNQITLEVAYPCSLVVLMTLVLVMKLSSVHFISIWYLSFAHGIRQFNDSQIRTCAMASFFLALVSVSPWAELI
jgi:hypothetical protein